MNDSPARTLSGTCDVLDGQVVGRRALDGSVIDGHAGGRRPRDRGRDVAAGPPAVGEHQQPARLALGDHRKGQVQGVGQLRGVVADHAGKTVQLAPLRRLLDGGRFGERDHAQLVVGRHRRLEQPDRFELPAVGRRPASKGCGRPPPPRCPTAAAARRTARTGPGWRRPGRRPAAATSSRDGNCHRQTSIASGMARISQKGSVSLTSRVSGCRRQ